MSTLPESNRNSLQSNSAAVLWDYCNGNVPLNQVKAPHALPLAGLLAEAAYLKARFYADRYSANRRRLSLLMRHGMFAEAALIITAAKFTNIQG